MKSFGYTKTERPKRPSNTKLFDFRWKHYKKNIMLF
jgi:hypothetical protein